MPSRAARVLRLRCRRLHDFKRWRLIQAGLLARAAWGCRLLQVGNVQGVRSVRLVEAGGNLQGGDTSSRHIRLRTVAGVGPGFERPDRMAARESETYGQNHPQL